MNRYQSEVRRFCLTTQGIYLCVLSAKYENVSYAFYSRLNSTNDATSIHASMGR